MQFKSPFRRLALFGAIYFVEGAVLAALNLLTLPLVYGVFRLRKDAG